jgi:hypothetical protein
MQRYSKISMFNFAISVIIIISHVSLEAQDVVRPLTLQKGARKISIPLGDWLVVTDSAMKCILGTGYIGGVKSEALILVDSNKRVQMVPVDAIGSIFHRKTVPVGYFSKKRLVFGFLVGEVVGLLNGVILGIIVLETVYILHGPFYNADDLLKLFAWIGQAQGRIVYANLYSAGSSIIKKFTRLGMTYSIGRGEWEIILDETKMESVP